MLQKLPPLGICTSAQLTLLRFLEGAELETFKGDRTLKDLTEYIDAKASEHAQNATQTTSEDEDLQDWVTSPPNAKAVNPEGKQLTLTQKTFPSAMKQGPMFVKFYAPWCGHCKKLAPGTSLSLSSHPGCNIVAENLGTRAPVWVDLASRLKGVANVAEVNCDDNSALCRNMKVEGYPTLILFNAGSKVDYRGSRKLDAMETYAKKATST